MGIGWASSYHLLECLKIYTYFITVIFTLDSDISEVCESNGTISLCLLASDMVGLVVEVDVQLNDVTTQGNKRDHSTIIRAEPERSEY